MGSHWELKHFGNEIMAGEGHGDGILSIFTLNFLNDIGWY